MVNATNRTAYVYITAMVDPGGATNVPSRYYRVRGLVPLSQTKSAIKSAGTLRRRVKGTSAVLQPVAD
jgi:hypothetical protein